MTSQVLYSIFTMAPVTKHLPQHPQPLLHMPMKSTNGLVLDLDRLSFAETAKFGELGRWPSSHLLRSHFPSFLEHGFEGHREPIEIKFEMSNLEPDTGFYSIKPFSVGYVDGQCKVIIMMSILALTKDIVAQQKFSMLLVFNNLCCCNCQLPSYH